MALEGTLDKSKKLFVTEELSQQQLSKSQDCADADTKLKSSEETQSDSGQLPSTSLVMLPLVKMPNVAQSPAIGVVSPMLSHRSPRVVSPHTNGNFSIQLSIFLCDFHCFLKGVSIS